VANIRIMLEEESTGDDLRLNRLGLFFVSLGGTDDIRSPNDEIVLQY
jgi:hypothetical protein